MQTLLEQLEHRKRKVDFDTYDISVKEIVSMAENKIIDVAPEYQRQFRWPLGNQSRLIETVFLGIPLPSLFMATNRDSSWELVDGVQRLNSLIHFVGNDAQRQMFNLKKSLKLEKLEILTEFNGKTFDELPRSLQLNFMLRPLKVTTLSDKSDLNVRFDLFERLNTGGIKLTDQEIRACVYRGKFNDFLNKLKEHEAFNSVVNIPKNKRNDGTREEWILRFFAYYYNRNNFKHSVVQFLNEYMGHAITEFNFDEAETLFNETFAQLRQELPKGIKRGQKGSTPANLYEAISVGAADTIVAGNDIFNKGLADWIEDDALTKLTTGATNSRPRLNARIDYCSGRFQA